MIIAKRDGQSLEPSMIRALVESYTRGHVPDYQMSAFLMAALLKGLDGLEAFALTEAMLESGESIDLSHIEGVKVDKHSTGGVGDKISIALAPLVAACGVPVPMISGRGLAHSGGTLDKLESIPGFSTGLALDEFKRQVASVGVAMIGQTEQIAPADRKIYALRDVTGTVDYPPFITASIMSKKLAEGMDALVLDVKSGSGAFMRHREDAEELARMLVEVAAYFGKQTVALITRMEAPLGNAVGNWPEVWEAVQCLKGEPVPDVRELTLALASEMLVLGRRVETLAEGGDLAERALSDGSGFQKLTEMVLAQGGDPWALERGRPHTVTDIEALFAGPDAGYVVGIDSRAVGYLAIDIGAGRKTMNDGVDPGAGILFHKRVGDEVRPGDRLATISTNRIDRASEYERRVQSAFEVGETAAEAEDLILTRMTR